MHMFTNRAGITHQQVSVTKLAIDFAEWELFIM